MYFTTGSLSRIFPLLYQLHDGSGGRHDFGQRRESKIVSTVMGSRVRFQRAVAEGLAIDHLAVVADQQDRARNFVVLDGGLDDGIEDGEICGLGLGERTCTGAPNGTSDAKVQKITTGRIGI